MIAKLRESRGEQKTMSTIDIHAYHTLSHEEALNAADELSADLSRKFGINYGWEEEVIHFERPGVNGQIFVQDTELRIQANLGFMLMMLKGPIEQ
jgi:putative polyhydroxyalkanoate system protein